MLNKYPVQVYKATRPNVFDDVPAKATGSFVRSGTGEAYTFSVQYSHGTRFPLVPHRELALDEKSLSAVFQGSLRLLFQSKRHFAAFQTTIQDIMRLRELSTLKASLAMKLHDCECDPSVDSLDTLARIGAVALPTWVDDVECHTCRREVKGAASCTIDGRHAWCSDCFEDEFGTTAASAVTGTTLWACPVCEAACGCQRCSPDEAAVAGQPMHCDFGMSLEDPLLRKYYRPQASSDAAAMAVSKNVRCLICRSTPTSSRDPRKLYRHPFATHDSKGHVVVICRPCANILTDRRRAAVEMGELLRADGGGSEELCAGCGRGTSGDPTELFCCSGRRCPRSFCKTCVSRLLVSSSQQRSMETDDHWLCPPCKHASRKPSKAKKKQQKEKKQREAEAEAEAGAEAEAEAGDGGEVGVPGGGAGVSAKLGTAVAVRTAPVPVGSPSVTHHEASEASEVIEVSDDEPGSGSGAAAPASAANGTGNGSRRASSGRKRKSPPRYSHEEGSDEESGGGKGGDEASSSQRSSGSGSSKARKRARHSSAGSTSRSEAQDAAAAELKSLAGGGQRARGKRKPTIDTDTTRFWATYYNSQMRKTGRLSPASGDEEEEDGDGESVCFSCKDGGHLLGCDHNEQQCPKQYHKECLGFGVDVSDDWTCPRHHCRDCNSWARYVCCFCPDSFCRKHFKRIRSQLVRPHGAKSAFLKEGIREIVCPKCQQKHAEAVDRGLVKIGL